MVFNESTSATAVQQVGCIPCRDRIGRYPACATGGATEDANPEPPLQCGLCTVGSATGPDSGWCYTQLIGRDILKSSVTGSDVAKPLHQQSLPCCIVLHCTVLHLLVYYQNCPPCTSLSRSQVQDSINHSYASHEAKCHPKDHLMCSPPSW